MTTKKKLNLSPTDDLRSQVVHTANAAEELRFRAHLQTEISAGIEYLLAKVPDQSKLMARRIAAEIAIEWGEQNR
jgi:hypothetical protein